MAIPSILSFILLLSVCQGWLLLQHPTSPLKPKSSALAYSSSSSDQGKSKEGNGSDDRKRMQQVRALQTAFYRSNTNAKRTELDGKTGVVYNLPLWRVPWIEVPGRTNILNVHEPMYTNMFESILHSEPPWYVGHLHLTGGTKNLQNPDYKLVTWHDLVGGTNATSAGSSNNNCLGTLMRIVDYRRMDDGRLLLLVQGLERFALTDIVQELPYSSAHVQLLPDTEEIEDSDWVSTRTEGDVSLARGLAVAESFGRWHRYEFEQTLLPLPLHNELNAVQVLGSALAQVLPYAPYSPVVNVEQLRKQEIDIPSTGAKDGTLSDGKMPDYAQQTLEHRLIQGNILREPIAIDPALLGLSCDELEIRLWVALDKLLKRSRKAVSPVLLGFLPHNVQWPRDFILEKIGDAIAKQTELASKYVRLSPNYPASRRHKRISFSVAALLEDLDTVNAFRQELLAIPSTRARMAYVLQELEDDWGVFQ